MSDEIREYAFFFLIWLLSTILTRRLTVKKHGGGLPPGPLALPIIGHLHLLPPIPHQSLAKLAARYGPLIHLHLGSVPCLVASSPEIAREILKTHEGSFSDKPQSTATHLLTYGSQDFMFAPYGRYWKFMKKLCMSELLGGPTLDLSRPVRHDETKRLIGSLAEKANGGLPVDVGKELLRAANNVMSSMIMSRRCSEDEDESSNVRKIVHETAELSGKFNLSDYIWFCRNLDLQGFGKRSEDTRNRFDEMMEKIIDEHQRERMKMRQSGRNEVKDLLHILLDASEDEGSEVKLTRDKIKAFVLDLFVAGTDTSAITTEWALAELINHPDTLRRAVQEIDSIVGKDRLIEESDIPNLPYLQAIVKESLRLHPAAPLIYRKSSRDCTVSGYHIPAKTNVFVNVWAINRDPNHWEDALEFRPERFLTTDKLDVRGQHYHFLPFGSGRRGCPGTSLAMLAVQATLGALIQCFEWKVDDAKVDMDEGVALSLPRAHPLLALPVPRQEWL